MFTSIGNYNYPRSGNCLAIDYVANMILGTTPCTPVHYTLYTSTLHLVHQYTTPCTPVHYTLYTSTLHLVHQYTTPCTPVHYTLYTSTLHLVHQYTTPCTPVHYTSPWNQSRCQHSTPHRLDNSCLGNTICDHTHCQINAIVPLSLRLKQALQ